MSRKNCRAQYSTNTNIIYKMTVDILQFQSERFKRIAALETF